MITTAARSLRRAWRRRQARSRLPHIQQSGLPVLFANSFPKSGTHLLTQILGGFTKFAPFVVSGLEPVLSFEGQSGRLRPPQLLARQLQGLQPGDISYGHVLAYPQTIPPLTADGMASFFIYRDPRDVVVSHVHYVTEINPQHVHHRYYTETLNSFDQRLETSIRGLPEAANPFPDIRARFEPYLPWLAEQSVHSLRFEDLVHQPEDAVHAILRFVRSRGFLSQISADEAQKTLLSGIDPRQSPTFRSGKTGAWRDAFTTQHKQLFKSVAGDLLVQLGYGQDQNW